MAMIEMNALSTVLCGSFSAKVFFPEMDKLGLGENDYDKKYPVLWLYHSDGGSSMDWLCTPAEKCAAENGIFIIAADVQHCLCTNMEYGPKYEEFMVKELPGIKLDWRCWNGSIWSCESGIKTSGSVFGMHCHGWYL